MPRHALLALLAVTLTAVAQPADQPATADPPATRRVPIEDLPPIVRLGVRAHLIARTSTVMPSLVIVSSLDDYAKAIAAWTPARRYPVLIDDTSPHARAQIARFVRAFAPTRIVRWTAPDPDPWPGDTPAIRARIEAALHSVWNLDGSPDPRAQMLKAINASPILAPGVVVASPADPAWTAALPIAAARTEPIIWVGTASNPSGVLPPDQADQLAADIEAALDDLGLAWPALGDRIDAATLCLNAPVKINSPQGLLALTDRIGRHADDTDGSRRWGWASQIIGSSSDAAYAAMCALFLTPASAWLLDGYDRADPAFAPYAMAPAADLLRQVGLRVTQPGPARRDLQLAATSAIDADLILINSSGNRDFFDLNPGRARPGDIPQLAHPAIVSMIHSWSTTQPTRTETIAGRFLDRGAYALVGSVHEPYLRAFLTPQLVVQRLRAGVPLAAAVRHDRAQPWKIAILGDALITLHAPHQRTDEPLPQALAGATDLADDLRAQLADEHFDQAITTLTMLGRDADALRLTRALLADRPAAITPALAAAAIPPAARAADARLVLELSRQLDTTRAQRPDLLDDLWNAARPLLDTANAARDDAIVAFFETRLRPDQLADDAIELAAAIRRTRSPAAALAFLQRIDPKSKREQQLLKQTIRRLQR